MHEDKSDIGIIQGKLIQERIALAFIVKNEGSYALKMLQSVRPIIGFVSVVDTGSTDDTNLKLIEFFQRESLPYKLKRLDLSRFDEMRNEAIADVPQGFDWVLMLDADEIILAKDHVYFNELINRTDVDAWLLPRLNYPPEGAAGFGAYPDYQGRLFRNTIDQRIRYSGAVHETLRGYTVIEKSPALASPTSEGAGLHIHHMKWQWKQKIDLQQREGQYQALAAVAKKERFAQMQLPDLESSEDVRSALVNKIYQGVDPLVGVHLDKDRCDSQGWASVHPYLTSTIEEIKPSVIVEIGVWKGGSSLTMARKLKELGLQSVIISVDTWLGAWDHWLQPEWFESLKLEGGYPTLFRTFVANILSEDLQQYILPLPLDSINAAHVLLAKKIRPGIIHIDAAHDYQSVMNDLKMWWPLVAPGGYLIGDDYNTNNTTWPEVKRAYDEFFGALGLAPFEVAVPKCRIQKPL